MKRIASICCILLVLLLAVIAVQSCRSSRSSHGLPEAGFSGGVSGQIGAENADSPVLPANGSSATFTPAADDIWFSIEADQKSDIGASDISLEMSGADGAIVLEVIWDAADKGDDAAESAIDFAGFEVTYDPLSLRPISVSAGDAIARSNSISLATVARPGLIPFGFSPIHGDCADLLQGNDGGIVLLRVEFVAGEFAPERRTSVDPSLLVVENLVIDELVDGTQNLTWTERNGGDYDASGEVGISDITPIAQNFGALADDGVGDDELERLIDGDRNGEVGISDITPIANNYLSKLAGYDVIRNDNDTGDHTKLPNKEYPADAEAITATRPVEGDPGWRENLLPKYAYLDEFEGGHSVSSIPRSRSAAYSRGAHGIAPNAWRVTSANDKYFYVIEPRQEDSEKDVEPGEQPFNVSVTIVPPIGAAPLPVDFTVLVAGGTPPYTYDWNFGDGERLDDTDLYVVRHEYESARDYFPTITIKDGGGKAFLQSLGQIRVLPGAAGTVPTPTNVRAEGDGTVLHVRWNPVEFADMDGYDVYYSPIPNDPVPTHYNKDVGLIRATNVFLVNELDPEAVYYIKLKAVDKFGNESLYSAEAFASIGDSDAPPNPPTSVEVSNYGNDLKVTWLDSSSGDLAGYRIYRSVTDDFATATLVTPEPISDLSYIDTTVEFATTYYYWVEAVDHAEQTGLSGSASGTTPDTPVGPPNITDVTPTEGLAGNEVIFVVTVTGIVPMEYSWDFGGGAVPSESTSPAPAVVLSSAGTYDASVTITNAAGADTYDFTLMVTSNEGPPVIESVGPLILLRSKPATIAAVVIGSEATAYYWVFGSGVEPGISNDAAPVISAASTGTYECSVQVFNEFGNDTFDFTLGVFVPAKVISVSPTWWEPNTPVTFSGVTEGDSPIAYNWNFGDGTTPNNPTGQSPYVITSDGGIYDASLLVANDYGSDIYEFELRIGTPVIQNITPTNGVNGKAVTFIADVKGTEPLYYEWDFGGGATPNNSTELNPVVTLGSIGTYDASLTLSNEFGSDDHSFTLEITEGWHVETVDSAGNVGEYSSIALDSGGYPHVSYLDRGNLNLQYANKDASVWEIETVDSEGSVGYWTSIALDSGGYPHVSNYDGIGKHLKYVYMDASGWHIETVDSEGDVGWCTSITLDSGGYPHVSYYDQGNYDLKYAYMDASGWHIETVDSEGDVGKYTSIGLDLDGYPHVSYVDETSRDLKYAYMDASGWHIETVDINLGNLAGTTSIAIDSGGYPHVSYYDDTNGDLKYAYMDASGWNIETVDSEQYVGRYSSIAIDSGGYPHISYWDYTSLDLKYAYMDASGWHIETVDSEGRLGEYSSIAIDSRGYPHISYWDQTNGGLKYAWRG